MMFSKAHIKATLRLSVPLIIGQFGQILMGVVDSVMVGRLGAAELAAVALGNSLYMAVLVFGIGLTMGMTPLVASRYGAGKFDECGVVLRQGLIAFTVIGLVMSTVTFIGADIIAVMGQPADVTEMAVDYTKTLALSSFPAIIFFAYKNFTDALNVTRPAMIITIAANLVNFAVNWVLIYGNLGFDPMGVVGAGWATFWSRVFMAVGMIAIVLMSRHFKQFDAGFHFRRFDLKLMKRLVYIGTGSGLQYVFEVGAFATASFLIGMIGKDELAAHQIAINLASITYMGALGVSMAAAIRVGQASGQGAPGQVRDAGFSAMTLIVTIMFINGLIFVLFRETLPRIYISDPSVESIASGLLIIAAAFQLADGIQAVGIGILRGLSDIRIPTIITFVAYWVICLPLGYLLGLHTELGVTGVWIGLSTGLILSAILLTIRFQRITK